MAEQAPAIQNKKLLLVAGILAMLVVILFNIYVASANRSGQRKTIELAAFTRSMLAGDKITEDALKPVPFPEEFVRQVPNVLEWKDLASVRDRQLIQNVMQDEFVRLNHVLGEESSLPSTGITPGMVSYTFQIDQRETPGDLLLPNSRVNVWGMFPQAMVVIERIRVLGVGGRGPGEALTAQWSRTPSTGQRSYNSLTIEVPPDVALQLANIRTHSVRDFGVQLLNPKDTPKGPIRVASGMEAYARTALAPRPPGAPAGTSGE